MNEKNIHQRQCSIQGCTRVHAAQGLCGFHYQRARNSGELKIVQYKIHHTFSNPKHIEQTLLKCRNVTTDGCWEWTRAKTYGYGRMMIDGKNYMVHRISAWIFKDFDLNGKLIVCHHCDNPTCFNPEHLFIGTNTDNVQDMLSKGRDNYLKGENNGRATFKNVDVIKIRELWRNGYSTYKLAKIFNSNTGTISNIVRYESYKYI